MLVNAMQHLGLFVIGQSAAAAPPPNGSLVGMFAPLLAFAAIFYFIVYRPTQRQRSEHQSLLNALQKDEWVLTSSGIIGRLHSIDSKIAVLEIGDKVKVKMLRDRIVSRWQNASAEAASAPDAALSTSPTRS